MLKMAVCTESSYKEAKERRKFCLAVFVRLTQLFSIDRTLSFIYYVFPKASSLITLINNYSILVITQSYKIS